MFCFNCGSQMSDDSRFCSNCGTAIEQEADTASSAPQNYSLVGAWMLAYAERDGVTLSAAELESMEVLSFAPDGVAVFVAHNDDGVLCCSGTWTENGTNSALVYLGDEEAETCHYDPASGYLGIATADEDGPLNVYFSFM